MSKLQYLDLTRCKISESVLESLFAKCQVLKKLSLDRIPLTNDIVNNICLMNHQTLQVLNLSRCKGQYLSEKNSSEVFNKSTLSVVFRVRSLHALCFIKNGALERLV